MGEIGKMADIVYVLINEAMPGLVKIGRTNNDLAGPIRRAPHLGRSRCL